MGKGKGGLPDRWLNYIPIGSQIKGVPIIACKVPLKEDLLKHSVNPSYWFTPDILVNKVPNVGCIVDLTATSRYYDPTVFTARGIQHQKIFCAGHVIPNKTTVERFFEALDGFLHQPNSRGKVLMVHCTHGLNRTGYLVSRYMVERRGFKPEDAIAAFNRARGHKIERTNYIDDILSLSQRVCANPVPLFQNRGPGANHAASNDSRDHKIERSSHLDGRRQTSQQARSIPIPFYQERYQESRRPFEHRAASGNQDRSFQHTHLPSYSVSNHPWASHTQSLSGPSPDYSVHYNTLNHPTNSANHHAGSMTVVTNQGRNRHPANVRPQSTYSPPSSSNGWNPTSDWSSRFSEPIVIDLTQSPPPLHRGPPPVRQNPPQPSSINVTRSLSSHHSLEPSAKGKHLPVRSQSCDRPSSRNGDLRRSVRLQESLNKESRTTGHDGDERNVPAQKSEQSDYPTNREEQQGVSVRSRKRQIRKLRKERMMNSNRQNE